MIDAPTGLSCVTTTTCSNSAAARHGGGRALDLTRAAGKQLRMWNSAFTIRMEYDKLPALRSLVRGGEPSTPDSQFFAERSVRTDDLRGQRRNGSIRKR